MKHKFNQRDQNESAKREHNFSTFGQPNHDYRFLNDQREPERTWERDREDSREYPMSASTPTFSGNSSNENAKEWLFTLETNMRASRIRADRKLDVAAGYLRKTALQEYQRLRESRDDELSWEEFKSILLKRFGYVWSRQTALFQDYAN
jgi:hypothetical protein